MSEEIRVGDKFKLTVEVVGIASLDDELFTCVLNGDHEDRVGYYTTRALRNAERLPRPLRVGDRVTSPEVAPVPGIIEWTDGARALVRWSSSALSIESVGDLTLAEESAS